MHNLRRSSYLERLRHYVSAPAVTVLTGLRRVGKSVLLRQFAAELEPQSTVVYVDKESLAFDHIRDAAGLLDHVEKNTEGRNEAAYIIIDEVQQIVAWERAVADLNSREGVHVIVAGSNASLLAGELASGIAGRYVTVPVYSLSLGEFADLYELTQGNRVAKDHLLNTYLTFGGLPGVLHTDLSDEVVVQMLRDVFNTIAFRDVLARHQIRDAALFEAVTSFAFDNVGSLLSAKRIADFLKSQRRSATVDTVLNYLGYLKDAFVLDLSGLLENLVYLELRRRGFDVFVGNLGDLEIDFVCERAESRTYVQVAYVIESAATLERELRPLLGVPDAYPRVLLSMDPLEPGRLEGVRWLNLVDFLLGAEL